MHKYLFFFLIPSLLIGAVSCQRNDDEPPAREIKEISRLYVSTSDYQAGASTNISNVTVIDPADQDEFPAASTFYTYVSAAKGGRMIHYTPESGLVFQGSINTPGTLDTTIQVMRVAINGVISSAAKLSSRRLDNVRGLHYTVVNDGPALSEEMLIALNKSDSTHIKPYLFAFRRPTSTGFLAKPRFEMELDFIPWGLTINNKDVFIVKTGDNGGIVAYKDFTQSFIDKVDTVLTNIPKSFELTVNGSKNLRGISYSKSKDILVLTDYDVISNVPQNGRILIFENFSTQNSTKTIEPTRVISGASSLLKQPMDVAIDPREAGKYIYVADSQAKRVFRFLISDEGNVKPNIELNLGNKTPESISLDAR
ncbi:NHL repeat-containing protein [Sphingobacterium bovistauri]|uniref:DUF4374 domain-containing protein n=1 Tax=Sphingobacterium bovistauri TaxID=2781959 RepID=A0ABS7Z6K2_9SPHI|nr:hypothetical protein [Sphingobacterium bovistauri]MCA5004495.1 hypothetical protein [Sphingobacterium bovistauri]